MIYFYLFYFIRTKKHSLAPSPDFTVCAILILVQILGKNSTLRMNNCFYSKINFFLFSLRMIRFRNSKDF